MPRRVALPVAQVVHRCPDCGQTFDGASALVDHALAPGAAHLRLPKRPWVGRAAAAVGVLGAASIAVMLALAAGDLFDKESAPEQPRSEAHKIAVELRTEGSVGEYRSVEPDDGWDAEYELGDGDGVIRSRSRPAEVEYEALSVDLEDDIERVADERGFDFED